MATTDPCSNLLYFIDCEFNSSKITGRKATLLEVGVVIVSPFTLEECGSRRWYIKPPSEEDVSKRLLKNKDYKNKATPFEEIAVELCEYLYAKVWVGHNIVKCDLDLLMSTFMASKMKFMVRDEDGGSSTIEYPVASRIIDTCSSFQTCGFTKGKRGVTSISLESLARHFKMDVKQKHDTLSDCRLLLKIILRCSAVLFLEPGKRHNCAAAEQYLLKKNAEDQNEPGDDHFLEDQLVDEDKINEDDKRKPMEMESAHRYKIVPKLEEDPYDELQGAEVIKKYSNLYDSARTAVVVEDKDLVYLGMLNDYFVKNKKEATVLNKLLCEGETRRENLSSQYKGLPLNWRGRVFVMKQGQKDNGFYDIFGKDRVVIFLH
ncbi:unnamed protein product [Cuscuta epithymum]|uniref:Exonuclease domain-containing protein n=2 Tax=Cuscuta epithymum TaxID=186058 RepID=A0AAV0EAG0_9ASTE|nr:unnamed protein product [Cuscuta epithymum]CAH9117131.1 unnamed protein product [Cuscuta epithymum]CAH9117135.1 unnamed protein product [Cuscuta epithymum]CAH9117139.1 unnamed protein product [Cuscuta epithymum]CAH9148351.1 unnamed protein product [Cuscuta epithymum]